MAEDLFGSLAESLNPVRVQNQINFFKRSENQARENEAFSSSVNHFNTMVNTNEGFKSAAKAVEKLHPRPERDWKTFEAFKTAALAHQENVENINLLVEKQAISESVGKTLMSDSALDSEGVSGQLATQSDMWTRRAESLARTEEISRIALKASNMTQEEGEAFIRGQPDLTFKEKVDALEARFDLKNRASREEGFTDGGGKSKLSAKTKALVLNMTDRNEVIAAAALPPEDPKHIPPEEIRAALDEVVAQVGTTKQLKKEADKKSREQSQFKIVNDELAIGLADAGSTFGIGSPQEATSENVGAFFATEKGQAALKRADLDEAGFNVLADKNIEAQGERAREVQVAKARGNKALADAIGNGLNVKEGTLFSRHAPFFFEKKEILLPSKFGNVSKFANYNLVDSFEGTTGVSEYTLLVDERGAAPIITLTNGASVVVNFSADGTMLGSEIVTTDPKDPTKKVTEPLTPENLQKTMFSDIAMVNMIDEMKKPTLSLFNDYKKMIGTMKDVEGSDDPTTPQGGLMLKMRMGFKGVSEEGEPTRGSQGRQAIKISPKKFNTKVEARQELVPAMRNLVLLQAAYIAMDRGAKRE